MPFTIIRGDITKIAVDAIVNAANSRLQRGGGVCGAIFAAAGAAELQAECDRIGGCQVGEAVITGGYRLPAKYIIHAVGPVWSGGNAGEARLLDNCYTNALRLALLHGCGSVAFPLISAGIYGYPKERALEIAAAAVKRFLERRPMTVYLVIFDQETFLLAQRSWPV